MKKVTITLSLLLILTLLSAVPVSAADAIKAEMWLGQIKCLSSAKGKICLGDEKRADSLLGKPSKTEKRQIAGTSKPTTFYTYKLSTGGACVIAHHADGDIIHIDCPTLK